MPLIGMTDAAKKAGYGSPEAVRRALEGAGVKLERVGRNWGVQSKDLDKFMAARGDGLPRPGRPRKPPA